MGIDNQLRDHRISGVIISNVVATADDAFLRMQHGVFIELEGSRERIGLWPGSDPWGHARVLALPFPAAEELENRAIRSIDNS